MQPWPGSCIVSALLHLCRAQRCHPITTQSSTAAAASELAQVAAHSGTTPAPEHPSRACCSLAPPVPAATRCTTSAPFQHLAVLAEHHRSTFSRRWVEQHLDTCCCRRWPTTSRQWFSWGRTARESSPRQSCWGCMQVGRHLHMLDKRHCVPCTRPVGVQVFIQAEPLGRCARRPAPALATWPPQRLLLQLHIIQQQTYNVHLLFAKLWLLGPSLLPKLRLPTQEPLCLL